MNNPNIQYPLLSTYGINQCAKLFITIVCYQQILEFLINISIFFYLSFQLHKKIQNQGCCQIPKTKTLILITLELALIYQLIYQIQGKFHWAYYLYVLFDYTYFIWIVYYFGKKMLKTWDQVYKLKTYKIIIGFIILLLVSNMVYSNYLETRGVRSLCNQKQYMYERFVGLIIEIILLIIGFYLNKGLIDKIEKTKQMTLNQKNLLRIQRSRKQLKQMTILIVIFMIGQVVLVFQNLYFKLRPNYNCNYIINSPAGNIIIQLIVQILGNYGPKIYTIYIFSHNEYQSNNVQQQQSEDKQMRYMFNQSVLIRRLSVITDNYKQ